MHYKFKTLVSTVSFSVVFVLIPLFFTGLSKGLDFYKEWLAAMLAHSNYIISPFTLDSLLLNYSGFEPEFHLTWYIISFIILIYISIKLYQRLRRKQEPVQRSTEQYYLMESFTLLAFIPNLVNTDSQQLLYSIPLVLFLTQYLIEKRNFYFVLPYILLFFFFSINQPDLLGRAASEYLYQMGIAGICNLLIIGFSWIIFLQDDRLFTEQPVPE